MAERRYRLTGAADADLEWLYDYGIDRYGPGDADRYYDGLIKRFEAIAETPLYGQAVDHIRPGYRRSVYRVNTIYYRIENGGVVIARVLGRQDPHTSLPDDE